MNDPTVPHQQQGGTGLSTAIVDIQTTEGEPIRWTFPVINGFPLPMVTQEIRERLRTNEGLNLDTLRVAYPAGPWNQPLDRDIPVIGIGPQPMPRVVPPQGGSGTAPPQNARKFATSEHDNMGPLPEAHPRQSPADVAFTELDNLLQRWSVANQLSSAEYYLFLSRALATHAMRLVAIERRPQQRTPG